MASRLPLMLWLVHMERMAKAKVDFRPNRIDEGEWQIVASLPGHEDRHIKGLTSRDDCYDWINGSRRIGWLRPRGYAKYPLSDPVSGPRAKADLLDQEALLR